MRIGFVSGTHGHLDLLEQAMFLLIETMEVDRVIPVGTAMPDAEAVLRARLAQFPAPAAPDSPAFADYVLASVLNGVVEAPAAELRRNEALQARLWRWTRETPVIEVAGVRIGIRTQDAPDVLVVGDGARQRTEHEGRQARLHLGHLRARRHEGEPATCAMVEAAPGGLRVLFATPWGEALGEPEMLFRAQV